MLAVFNRHKRLISSLGLLLVALIWGSTFTLNKIALDSMSPISLMAARFILAFIVMLAIFRKKFRNITIKNCIGGILCGIALFLAFILQTYGLVYTTASKQAFLSGTYVIFVPLLTWICFKKMPAKKVYLGVFICFLGISLLSVNDDFTMNIGDVLTLISGIMFAAQILVAGHFVKTEDPAVMSTVQFGVTGILAAIVALFLGDFGFLNAGDAIIPVIYLGLFGSAAAYYLQILCQQFTSSSTTAIILSMETVFGSLLAVFFLKEIFTLRMIVGSIAILVAIIISET
ncbi:MAG: DMT family transporter [Proteocatella sp.]